ncbi:hypothetical protein JRQ81_017382, partial [Phrynocephalus forsythii]
KHGGDALSASSGTRNLQCAEGKMDSLKYQDILGESVMSSLRKLKLWHQWTGQQHNDPKHTSNATKAWLQKRSWKILQWPSQSPDLNLKANLWWDLKKMFAACKPKNVTQLKTVTREERPKTPWECYRKLVSGYSAHLHQVIIVERCSTMY